jgi:hypothetical protein
MSLKAALEQLGFAPCYHMIEVFSHAADVPIWEAAARGEKVDWQRLLAGWQAAVDWPPCSFYQELMAVYPEAKVILTEREPAKWYESAKNTIYLVRQQAQAAPPPMAHAADSGQAVNPMQMINQLIWDGDFHGRFDDPSYAMGVFERHNADVKKNVPPERLLVYDIRQGWEPLCQFLDVPVPQGTPFPHLNDTAAFLAMIGRMREGDAR